MPNKNDAKVALDKIIKKSRIHLYKPIQIAEILYRIRTYNDINPLNLEDYRTKSRAWRNAICQPLLGQCCTSSSRFQDNLFDYNAIPPLVLNELSKENIRTNGGVEAYIYRRFINKHTQLSNALSYCFEATPDTFNVKQFIDLFWNEPGLKRSLDKIYEIIVYSLFSTLVQTLNLQVEISISEKYYNILTEFEDFTQKVMCLDISNTSHIQDAKIYRVGVTNAADRGLDMYSNWGPAIQVKHLSLDVSLAENIVSDISSDRIVIVCKSAEKDIIVSLLTQIGWRSHIQSIVTEDDLIAWYEKALHGNYSDIIGSNLISCLCDEISNEFPSVNNIPDILKQRHYEKITDSFWT